MLYYNASTTGEASEYDVVGSSIGLITAPEPTGPCTQDKLVLNAGEPGEWDEGFVVPNSVIATDEGYRMYYTSGMNPDRLYIRNPDNEGSSAMCGMAISTDGINWTKHDDPSTTEALYAESDPVLQPSPSGWDSVDVKCSVMKTDIGWEMLYKGLGVVSYSVPSRYGFATSADGVN